MMLRWWRLCVGVGVGVVLFVIAIEIEGQLDQNRQKIHSIRDKVRQAWLHSPRSS